MGIRVALLVAKAPAAAVLSLLSHRYGTIPAASHRVSAGETSRFDEGVLLVAEGFGLCVVDDPEFVLPADADLAVEVSRQLNCAAATLLTESTTETHQLVVADAGRLRRAFYCCGENGTGPALLGAPLASESTVALNDSTGGEHLLELLALEGFDVHPFLESGSWSVHELADNWTGVPATPGPTAAALEAEIERVSRTRPIREAPPTVTTEPKSTGGWLKRLFGG